MSQITSEPSQAFLVETQSREQSAARSMTPWIATLWKDAYQVSQAVGAVCIGMLFSQLLMFVTSLASRDLRDVGSGNALLALPSLTPFLVILACAGILIGHERQTRTAEWHSSLPGSWKLALTSKLLVTFASALLAPLPLVILPFLTSVSPLSFEQVGGSDFSVIVMLVLWGVNVTVWMFLFTQLIDESLWAIVFGGIFLAIMQICVAISLSAAVGWERPVVWHESPLFWGELITLILVGTIAMATVFKWRWGAGQRIELSLVGWLPARKKQTRAFVFADTKQPSQFGALFNQSRVRATKYVIACAVLLTIGLWSVSALSAEVFAVTFYISIVLLGVATFDGDHVMGRSRFWADRGVSVWRLLLAKVLTTGVPLLLMCLVAMLGLFFKASSLLPAFYWVLWVGGIATYLLAAIFSLACKRAIVAITMTVLTSLGVFMLMNLVFALVVQAEWLAANTLIVFALLSIPALIWILYRSTRKWIVEHEAKLFATAASWSCVACLLPVILATCFSFLFVSSVSWQGFDPRSYRPSPVEVYDLDKLTLATQELEFRSPALAIDTVDALVNSLTGNGDESAAQIEQVAAVLKEMDGELEANQFVRVLPSWNVYQEHGFAITNTAWLSLAFIKLERYEDARNALRVHQKIVDRSIKELPLETASDRLAAIRLWHGYLSSLATENQAEALRVAATEYLPATPQITLNMAIGGLGGKAPDWFTAERLSQVAEKDELIRLLVPQRKVTAPQREKWLKTEATADLAALLGEPIDTTMPRYGRYYSWLTMNLPPLRWRAQRMISLELANCLGVVRSGSYLAPRQYVSAEMMANGQQAEDFAQEVERLLQQLLANSERGE